MANIYTDIKMFDAESYLANNPDLGEAGYTVENVAEHYVEYGAAEGRAPNAWFDIDFYREQNADLVVVPTGELLLHFAKYGAAEGRNPNPAFGEGQSIAANLFLDYALANKDLQEAFGIAAGATRLTDEQQAKVANHFFTYGINEGREGGIADVSTNETDAVIKAVNAYKATLTAQAAADKAEKEVIKSAAEHKDVTGINKNSTAEAVKTAVKTAVEGAETAVANASGDTITGDVSDTKIANAEKALKAKVDAAQIKVDAQAANAPTVIALQQQLKAQADAVKAAKEVNTDFKAEAAKYEIANGNAAGDVKLVDAVLDTAKPADSKPFHATIGAKFVVTVINGKTVVYKGDGTGTGTDSTPPAPTWKDGVPSVGGEKLSVATDKDLKGVKGLDALLATIVAVDGNNVALNKANAAVEKAIVDALKAAGYKPFDGAADKATPWNQVKFDKDGTAVIVADPTNKPLNFAKTDADGKPVDDGKIAAEAVMYVPATQVNSTQVISGGDTDAKLTGTGLASTEIGAAAGKSADAVTALGAAETNLKNFQKAVESYNELKALQTELADAAKDVEAAGKAVAEAEKAFADLDINLVKAEDGVASGDAYDEDDAEQFADLFVFSSGLKTVDNFDGDDLFYFGDDAVALIPADKANLAAGKQLGGQADVLEIFAVQDGANTVLYVEKEAVGGNSSNLVDENNKDFVKIELVGVNAEDLQFDGGFLTLA